MIFFFAGVSAAKKKHKSSLRSSRLERAQRMGGEIAKGVRLKGEGFKPVEFKNKKSRLTVQQLDQALDYQKKIYEKLGNILKKFGHSTEEEITRALNRMKRKLGEMMIFRMRAR